MSKLLSSFKNLSLLTKPLNYGLSLSNPVNSCNPLNIFKCNQNGFQIPSCGYYSMLGGKSFLNGDDNFRKSLQMQQLRNITVHHVNKPNPATTKKNLRFKVHYPEDGKYTIRKLRLTKLGGRDPDTGRLIFGKIGGGHKRHFRWVLFDRVPEGSKDPLIEKVIHVQYDPNRTALIALVGHEDKLRFLLATSTMKEGDLIMSTREIPRMPVRPKEGDAHPLGALPNSTVICSVELIPHGAVMKVAAGTSATIVRRHEGKVLVQVNSFQEYALDPECLAVVGQISNSNHGKKIIGSAQRSRWLGIRPSSGLFQKKDGRFGYRRKYKKPPILVKAKSNKKKYLDLNITGEGPSKRVIPSTQRVS